jgi:hypothetical protein
MKPPVLLSYNLQGERANQIRLTAMRLTVRFRPVAPEEYGQPLAALCGMEPPAETPPPAEAFTDEMLVLAHFSTDLLNRFLYAFRKDGVPPLALKAMLTETNMRWSSATLHAQLKEEHEALISARPPVHTPEDD